MSAQCGGAAQADIAQYLPLLVRQYVAPSVEGTDLDAHGGHRPLQAKVRSCRSVPSVSSWRGPDRKIVERTRCGAQPGFGNMEVPRCRLEIAMAEQQLDAAQISPCIQQMCRERVAQNVRAQRLFDTKLLTQLLADDTNRVRLQRLSRPFPLKQPVLWLAPAPVHTQDLQQLRRQHDLTGKLALAFADVDDHPLAVDIGHLQIQRFLATKACAVVQGEQRAMLGVHLRVEQSADFFPAPDRGQFAPYLGLDDLLIKPGLLQRPRVEKLQR